MLSLYDIVTSYRDAILQAILQSTSTTAWCRVLTSFLTLTIMVILLVIQDDQQTQRERKNRTSASMLQAIKQNMIDKVSAICHHMAARVEHIISNLHTK